jgi:DNA helicase-2/ATP-dependent DNA helicase PcrA
MNNQLTLAVAGSRKTQSIVDYCASLPVGKKAAVVTFTQTNQAELVHRLSVFAGHQTGVEVRGWYTFLLRDFARPFLPFLFPGERVNGFNFEGRPHRMAKGIRRFLDSNNAVYACELGSLACKLIDVSKGKLLHRLECIYDEILIDEVQDLSGYDWEIIDVLIESSIDLKMVGDIRQSVLSTNPRGKKNKKYEYASIIEWFREREQKGTLEILENNTTWRCHPDIAKFSDYIFHPDWQFPETISAQTDDTGHDGVFLIDPEHVHTYVALFSPQSLRDTANSGKSYELNYLNFKVAKGTTYDRVLIVPTGGITKFIKAGTYLNPTPAASFYVAVTRAKHSVAIVVPTPYENIFELPVWEP